MGFLSTTVAAQMASAQTGPIVITKGRMVSLTEWELRSKASNTRTVPYRRTASATETPPAVDSLMAPPTRDLARELRNVPAATGSSC